MRRWSKRNVISHSDGTDTYQCSECKFKSRYEMYHIPVDCPKCSAQEIIYGGWHWTSSELSPKCIYCKADCVECPESDHPNSKYWALERDNQILIVCPNGCYENGQGINEKAIIYPFERTRWL